jgi:hypothetical protein
MQEVALPLSRPSRCYLMGYSAAPDSFPRLLVLEAGVDAGRAWGNPEVGLVEGHWSAQATDTIWVAFRRDSNWMQLGLHIAAANVRGGARWVAGSAIEPPWAAAAGTRAECPSAAPGAA